MNLPDENSAADEGPLVGGRYRLIRRIDAGGMGEVFEAAQISTQRRVALKLMRNASDRQSNRKRFTREAEHLARLHHPNIAQIFDAGEHVQPLSSVPFIAMELIVGGQPITRWSVQQSLSMDSRLSLVATACDALAHAHAANVIHRDLKPSNVLIDSAGALKLIDFGLSQTLRPLDGEIQAGETLYSDASLLFGTPEYMAPECFNQRIWRDDGIEGQRSCTVAQDIYGIGVILFQLVTGKLPFELSRRAAPEVAVFGNMLSEIAPPLPSRLNPAIGADLETVLLKCLAKEPNDRYRTATELATDLRCVIAREAITAKRPGQLRKMRLATRRAMRRRPTLSMLAVFAGVLILSRFAANRLDLAAGLRFERFLVSHRSLQYFNPDRDLSHVRLISIPPGLNPAQLAAGLVPTSLMKDARVLRAVHGALMQRIGKAECTPLSFAWDVIFDSDADPAIDRAFADGAAALTSRNIGVVVATQSWDAGRYSRQIASATTPASVSASITLDSPWSLMAARLTRGGALQSSLSLTAAGYAELQTAGPLMGATRVGDVVLSAGGRETDFPYTLVRSEDADAEHGVKNGDIIAQSFIELPSAQSLADVTVSYLEVLNADRDQLHRWFDGRVVLVADSRLGNDVVATYFDGQAVVGGYVNLVAIEQQLEGRAIRYLPMLQFGFAFINAAYLIEGFVFLASLQLGVRLAFSNRRRVMIESLALLGCVAGSLLLYREAGLIYSPIVLLVTIPLAVEVTAAARRVLPRIVHPQ